MTINRPLDLVAQSFQNGATYLLENHDMYALP